MAHKWGWSSPLASHGMILQVPKTSWNNFQLHMNLQHWYCHVRRDVKSNTWKNFNSVTRSKNWCINFFGQNLQVVLQQFQAKNSIFSQKSQKFSPTSSPHPWNLKPKKLRCWTVFFGSHFCWAKHVGFKSRWKVPLKWRGFWRPLCWPIGGGDFLRPYLRCPVGSGWING